MLRATLPAALELERTEGRAVYFHDLDALLNSILERMLAGSAIADFGLDRNRPRFVLTGLDANDRRLIDKHYALASLEERSCFFAPEEVSVGGVIQFPYFHRGWPRFAARITREVQVKVQSSGSPQSIFGWSLLTPIAELLYAPVRVAGRFDQGRLLEKLVDDWPTSAAVLADLGFDVVGMGVTERTGRWNNQQLWRREQILTRLQYRPDLGTSIRTALTRQLAARYYAKVDKKGQLTRKRMLTREYEQLLVGLFRGSWRDFVEYLGEQLHPDDAIDKPAPTALVAPPVELPPPVQARLGVAARYWIAVGQIERSQRATDSLPIGLVPEGDNYLVADGRTGRLVVQDGWKSHLPSELNAEILRQWGSEHWPAASHRIVTTPNRHFNLAQAVGPALRFWHGSYLTVWYMCRGGWSRTTLKDLGRYYERELLLLSSMGCPVEAELLDSIANAERLLGAPRQVAGKREVTRSGGIEIELSTEITIERGGFEAARDVISTARDRWTFVHLENYLQRRGHQDLEDANRFYWRTVADRGRPPTLKQFASIAGALAVNWLGGEIAVAYVAVGAESPITTDRVGRPALPRVEFVQKVLEGLAGGRPLELDPMKGGYRESWELVSLANSSFRYLQVMEGTGDKPKVKDMAGVVERLSEVRAVKPEEILDWYAQVVDWALAQFGA